MATVINDIPVQPFTCAWAQAGLQKALDGWVAIASGVQGYGIGTRWVRYKTAAEQGASVDYWTKMVEQYCGLGPTPDVVTGRESACRIVPRDV